MPRLAIAECKQEVSSFNPHPSRYADFAVSRGQELLDYHRQVREEVGGALSVFDAAAEVVLAPTLGARANTSGGILTAESFERLSQEFLDALSAAGPVDGAYFSLHGAMQSAAEHDPEGYLLEHARRILGPRVPLVVSLDLHGILTDRMLRNCDAVVIYHTYPHVDFFETGARAARLLLRMLREDLRPVTARIKIPALVRGDELITETGAIRECITLAQQIEAAPRGLSAGVMWGNPFTDVPDLRTNAVVVMDGEEAAAADYARELAARFWKHHLRMRVPLTPLAESVRQAAAATQGTVVLMDAADAPSSGASGDSNAILAELLRQDYRGTALVPIVDSPAVQQALTAGIGGTIRTTVGGKLDTRYTPLAIEGQVRLLADGRFRSESFGWHWNAGLTAVVQSGRTTLVIGSRPVSLFDRSYFYAHGQDPRRFDLVVVKSPHCEHHMFAAWCAKLINVDAPGSTSADVRQLGHRLCPRPIFPLDEGVTFEPRVEIFSSVAR